MSRPQDCQYCHEPIFQDIGLDDPRKIVDLDVSTAALYPSLQSFRGYTLLALREHATELWQLDADTRQKFMEEACRVSLAISNAFKPLKMNYCVMGNTVPHLHWHLIPRYPDDQSIKLPIWTSPLPRINPSDEELRGIAAEIRKNL